MKILFTGSTGFIGRHLYPLLKQNGYEVHQMTRHGTNNPFDHEWNFIDPLPENLPHCDAVIHFAADVRFSEEFETFMYMVNTISLAKLAKYCLKTGAVLIFASSSSIYGNTGYIKESSPFIPTNHYSMSKFLAEQIIRTFLTKAFVLRIYGVYGLNGPSHLGINTAIRNALQKGTPPILHGDGKGKRNYISVDELAKWILCIIETMEREDPKTSSKNVETVLMAGTEMLSIREYLQTIIDVFLPGSEIIIKDGPESRDYILEPSSPPFPLKTFKQYLYRLKEMVD